MNPASSLALVTEYIEEFDIDPSNYFETSNSQIKTFRPIGNRIFHKSFHSNASIEINFGGATGCTVFIGKQYKGSLKIQFGPNSSGSQVYIGDSVDLRDLQLKLRAQNSGIYIGAKVTTSGPCLFVARSDSQMGKNIIIGDHCLLSYDITIRNDDQHPVFDTLTWARINEPKAGVTIEPYCWIGHRATILKNVLIGACSIVGSCAVVTKSAPRFSSVTGSPAVFKSIKGKIWSRGVGPTRDDAIKYLKRFAEPGSYVLPSQAIGIDSEESQQDED